MFESLLSILLGLYLAVELQALCLTLWGTAKPFSTAALFLHSYQQCTRVSIPLHSCQHLVFLVFLITVILLGVKWVILIWVLPMASDVDHFFMCLLALCIYFLKKYLFKSFVFFFFLTIEGCGSPFVLRLFQIIVADYSLLCVITVVPVPLAHVQLVFLQFPWMSGALPVLADCVCFQSTPLTHS